MAKPRRIATGIDQNGSRLTGLSGFGVLDESVSRDAVEFTYFECGEVGVRLGNNEPKGATRKRVTADGQK
jgi:hypothetical protein